MKFWVEWSGKRKDAALHAFIERYQQRARSLVPIELRVHRTMKVMRERMQPGTVLLDERGASMSSKALAQRCASMRDQGIREIRFAIGDAHGFTDADRAAAPWLLSLSAMTLPHHIAQLVLVEQLYRVGTILSGHPYHHAD